MQLFGVFMLLPGGKRKQGALGGSCDVMTLFLFLLQHKSEERVIVWSIF